MTVDFIVDNGEDFTITWDVRSVNCLVISTSALRRGGSPIVEGPERELMNAPIGESWRSSAEATPPGCG